MERKGSLERYQNFKQKRGTIYDNHIHDNSRGSTLLAEAEASSPKTRKFRFSSEDIDPRGSECEGVGTLVHVIVTKRRRATDRTWATSCNAWIDA